MSDTDNRLNHLIQVVSNMDELIMRLAICMTQHLPSTDREVAAILGEWNEIKKGIADAYKEAKQ